MNPEPKNSFFRKLTVFAAVAALAATLTWSRAHAADAVPLPDPSVDAPRSAAADQTAVFSGGCFWGIQAVFQHVQGVKRATSGYSGGPAAAAQYELVSSGETGHAESVEVTYDPARISYGQLLKIFFSVAHDPTQLNRQGPDSGIFYGNEQQKHIAEAYIAQLQQAKSFPRPIVTEVSPLKAFYPAEPYHQNYATLHPDNPYIAANDAPKVEHLRQQFPDLYKK
jgi:peptide-methionine (S)-S-oxide reductase